MKKIKILHIENSHIFYQFTKSIFKDDFCQVHHCKNIDNAQDVLNKSNAEYDLILLDINEFNDLDIINLFLQYEIPIIVLTANNDVHMAKRAINMGCSDYFVKPIIDYQNLLFKIKMATSPEEDVIPEEVFEKLKPYINFYH